MELKGTHGEVHNEFRSKIHDTVGITYVKDENDKAAENISVPAPLSRMYVRWETINVLFPDAMVKSYCKSRHGDHGMYTMNLTLLDTIKY